MAIDWARGYSAEFRLYEVDSNTWVSKNRVGGVASTTIERSCEGDAPELESASVEVDMNVGEMFTERMLRLSMVATQGSESQAVDVCTQTFVGTSGDTAMGRHVRTLRGLSVLHPAACAKTWLSWRPYVNSGADATAAVAGMLRSCIMAPVTVEGSFALASAYVFDREESVLTSAWTILRAGGYRMRITGRGEVQIVPDATTPSLTLDRDGIRLLLPSITDSLDYTEVPNQYTAEEGTSLVTVTNDDKNSVVSTVARGYVVDAYDGSPQRLAGESLDAYAHRKLVEASTLADAREWEREWQTNVLPGDLIRANVSNEGLEGDFRVVRQSLRCGAGIVITERAEREVSLWQG